jgi:hypothetical protein
MSTTPPVGHATRRPAASGLPAPVVPFAVAMRTPLRPDLVPLDRPVPDHVDDPGPATVLRLDAGTAGLVRAKRRLVTRDPAPWTAVGALEPARLRAAGRELAAVVARAHPHLLRIDAGRLELPGIGVVVDDDDVVARAAGTVGRARPTTEARRPAEARWPGGVRRDADAGLVTGRLEEVAGPRRWLEAVALAVGEDLVLVDRTGHVGWLHVCAPSGWDPGGAGGAPLTALHEPIPHADRLRDASPALGRALVTGGPFVRWTWGLTPDPGLAHHPRLRGATAGPAPAPGALTFRAERQTTLALPRSGLGLFAIRVHRAPLARVVDRPGRAAALAATVAALPEALAAYKGVADRRREIVTWLEDRAPVAARR